MNLVTWDTLAHTQTTSEQQSDGSTLVVEAQNVEPILDSNRRAFNTFDERARYTPESYDRVASIPLVIWLELWDKGIAQDNLALEKWLDDADNRAFRTRPGRLTGTTRGMQNQF